MKGHVFPSRSHASILVVDDDLEILELLKIPLDREGYQVHFAQNGQAALEHVATRHIDLILTDVDMPTMNGYELVKRVKENPRTAGIPILFLSAYDQLDDRLKGLELGANDYISKPFNPREVGLRVRNMLKQQTRSVEGQTLKLLGALNLIQLGIVMFGDSGEVTVINAMAQEILEQADGLSLRGRKLCGSTVAETREIDDLIASARTLVSRFDATKVNPIRVKRPSLLRDYSLIALPFDVSVVEQHDGRRAIGLVIHDPENTNIPEPGLLINAYQFTKAEAKVAALLIQGKSIAEICDDLEVSRNTVCTHLKKLYMKTDTQRQSDFTRLLLSGLSQLKLR